MKIPTIQIRFTDTKPANAPEKYPLVVSRLRLCPICKEWSPDTDEAHEHLAMVRVDGQEKPFIISVVEDL